MVVYCNYFNFIYLSGLLYRQDCGKFKEKVSNQTIE